MRFADSVPAESCTASGPSASIARLQDAVARRQRVRGHPGYADFSRHPGAGGLQAAGGKCSRAPATHPDPCRHRPSPRPASSTLSHKMLPSAPATSSSGARNRQRIADAPAADSTVATSDCAAMATAGSVGPQPADALSPPAPATQAHRAPPPSPPPSKARPPAGARAGAAPAPRPQVPSPR